MSDFIDGLWGDTPQEERDRLVKEARDQMDGAEHYICFYENCTWFYDAEQGEIIGGMGVAGCRCEENDDEKMMLWRRVEA